MWKAVLRCHQFVFTSLSVTFSKISCLLKNRFILFLPIANKYTEFCQTGKLRVNQIFTILPSFLQSHNTKET